MNAQGAVRLIELEPGDGQRYRVLFGRLGVDHPSLRGYIIFGIAEGHDPIITAVLDANRQSALLDYESRAVYEGAHNTPAQMRRIAAAVYAALVNIPDIPAPEGFRPDWAAPLDRSTGGGGQ